MSRARVVEAATAPARLGRSRIRVREASLAASLALVTVASAGSQTRRGVEPVMTDATAQKGGGRWAVLVGVDQYQRPDVPRLQGAVADAKAIAEAAIRYAGFPAKQVFVLTSDAPTKPTASVILDTFNGLRSAVQPGDLLLFFFAGHGVEVEGRRYLLTYESNVATAGTLKTSTLQVSQLMQEIESLPVTHRIIMVDACRDDPISRGRRQPNIATAALEAAFTLQPSSEGGVRATFLSSSRGQSAYEWTEKRRGFFSYFIERGLAGEAATYGKVTVTSLAGYLNEFVPRAVREQRGREQTPFMDLEGQELVLVGGVAADRSALSAAQPSRLGTRTVYGVVKDSDGRPLAGVSVRVAWSGGLSRSAVRGSATPQELLVNCDEDGFFKAEVPSDATVSLSTGGTPGFGVETVRSSPDDAGKKMSLFLPALQAAVGQGPARPPSPADEAQELAKVAYQSFIVEQFQEAEAAATKALARDSRNALAQAVLANCLAVRGANNRDAEALGNARKWAQAVLMAEPQMALAHNAMGLVLLGFGDLRGAQAEFLKAQAIEPNLSVAGANLGHVYYQMRQYPLAERAYRNAIRARPEAAVPYNGLALVLLAEGRPREATKAALGAISRYETQDQYLGRFYVNLAVALQDDHGKPSALEAVARAKSLGVRDDPAIAMIERLQASGKKR
jgi:tetratricopeptide (TPR) repeat protein